MFSKISLAKAGANVVSRNYVRGSTESSHKCRLLVLGGGTGGCSMAAKFVPKLGKNSVIIVDPADTHYYQPMLTLVGGGLKRVVDTGRPMKSVLPKNAKWIKESVAKIDPIACEVTTTHGTTINYDYLIVSLGLELHYDKVKGLEEALQNPGNGVCSNYSPRYAERTIAALKNFKKGNAVFTFPNTPVKCAGAPLKACLISEHFLRKAGLKNDSKIYYRTSLPVIFSVKHYAEKLMALCAKRDIDVAYRHELVEVDADSQQATFRNIDKPEETEKLKFSMLHAVPPMGPPKVLKESGADLTDSAGYLSVSKHTLVHDKYSNIFGIGDCTNLPTSKTAAAIAAQSGVLYDNLWNMIRGKKGEMSKYDGYTSCPLVTGYGTCILAEFDYSLTPLETFPIDQSKETYSMYFMKKDVMPPLYWHAMLNGYWRGPGPFRKILHLGMGR